MSNRYRPPLREAFLDEFRTMPPDNLSGGHIFPRKLGPFIRAAGEGRQAVVGQWGLVPWFGKQSTHNVRVEDIVKGTPAILRDAWQQGQRCLIPAQSFDELNWESGKNEWWRFRRADGRAWGLAGLWSTWTDKTTGEVIESYAMILGVSTSYSDPGLL